MAIGYEGGIPYRRQPQRRIVHKATGFPQGPLCGSTAWHLFTTHNDQDVTCWDCKRKEAE